MFRYKLAYFNKDKEIQTDKGVVKGINHLDAIRNLMDWYGEDDIFNIEELWEIDEVLTDEDLTAISGS